MPEQLQLHGSRPTLAALIGRQGDGQGLAILEPSVSRHDAHITFDGDAWTLRDLGSANGSYQDDKLIEGPVKLREGDRVRFGHIAFYFVEDVTKLPEPR